MVEQLEQLKESVQRLEKENSEKNSRKRRRSSDVHTHGTKGRVSMLSEDVEIIKWAAVGAGSAIGTQSGQIASLEEQHRLLCYQLNEAIPAITRRLDEFNARLG